MYGIRIVIIAALLAAAPLTLASRACAGTPAAAHELERRVAEAARMLASRPRLKGVSQAQREKHVEFVVGNLLFVLGHETGHALIREMGIPVVGREEDAADFFSIYFMLQFPPADARRLIEGIAFNMGSEARPEVLERQAPQKFAGPHAMNAQRHYNVLCLAYGSNPALFGGAVPPGLPPWRARWCGDDWGMLRRAFNKLILPHVDEARLKDAIAQTHFGWSPLSTATESFDKPPLGD